jgi:hypothetical protein
MYLAMRSFMLPLPPVFCPSSLANILTFLLGLIRAISTSGVLPIDSTTFLLLISA